jgi:hypothetical protein
MNSEAVARVCRLPVEFPSSGISWRDLVAKSGWPADPESILGKQLAEYLRDKPALVDAWLGYSEDKRSSPGWYLQEDGRGGYIVGWYPGPKQDRFSDRILACAEFIRRELEEAVGPAA